VELAILVDDRAVLVHVDGRVEIAAVGGFLRIAEMEGQARRARAAEERLHRRIGHGRFEELVVVAADPLREVGGQGQLRIHEDLHLRVDGLLHQGEHAADDLLAAGDSLFGPIWAAAIVRGRAIRSSPCSRRWSLLAALVLARRANDADGPVLIGLLANGARERWQR